MKLRVVFPVAATLFLLLSTVPAHADISVYIDVDYWVEWNDEYVAFTECTPNYTYGEAAYYDIKPYGWLMDVTFSQPTLVSHGPTTNLQGSAEPGHTYWGYFEVTLELYFYDVNYELYYDVYGYTNYETMEFEIYYYWASLYAVYYEYMEEVLGYGEDSVTIPHRVRITSANVTQGADGKIHVMLEPASATGNFTLQLLGPVSHTIINSVSRSGGERDEGFDIPSLSNGEYTQVKATWTVNGIPQYATYAYHIKVLGNYNHTQYNVPDESLCSGTAQAIKYTGPGSCSYLANCNALDSTAKSGWISEVAENGSGKHSTLGFVTIEGFCSIPNPKYRDLSSGEGCPYCPGESLIANATVAINGSNPDLKCGDRVFVYQIQGQTSGVFSVTDHGGGVGITELDHYVGSGACNAATTIGLRMTIKLY